VIAMARDLYWWSRLSFVILTLLAACSLLAFLIWVLVIW
jgi:hypothetical protein